MHIIIFRIDLLLVVAFGRQLLFAYIISFVVHNITSHLNLYYKEDFLE